MTILGVQLRPEHALMWTDSELYGAGSSPSGYAPKLHVNAAICAVGCGSGFDGIIAHASQAMATAIDFDELPDAIRDALRVGVTSKKHYFDGDPTIAGCTYVIAGWSKRAGRMVAWEFDIARWFAPVLTTQSNTPHIDLSVCWEPRGPDDVVAVARRQMALLRQHLSGAGAAGSLTIAHIARGNLSVQSIDDFDADIKTRPTLQETVA